ncbi:MAG: apiosidase-like domain-containing protein [bacterium]
MIEVPLWRPKDLEFKGMVSGNPFEVDLFGRAVGPQGESIEIPGFYDGGETWKVRFSPVSVGSWKINTRSSNPSLDGRTVEVLCTDGDPSVHGGLRVDPQHRHHFVYEDGTRYFLLGYECDWLWALGREALESFLDKLVGYGFNYVVLNLFAYDTLWRRGKTEEMDFGPPDIYPWAGTNDAPDHRRFNLDFWKRYDFLIDSLLKRGIVAHIMIKVYNKFVNWPDPASPEDDLYFKYVISRYSAYPNVIWDFSKEAFYEKDLDYKLGRFSLIRGLDPYKRPLTCHDDDLPYDTGSYNDVLDFRTDQQHSDWYEFVIRQRAQNPWPILNAEFGYEHGPGGPEDKTYRHAQPPEEVVRRAWEVYMAGGYGVYYYTYTAWDIIHPEDDPPGYKYFRNLRRFFESSKYWLMVPSNFLVSEGRCLASPEGEYLIALEGAKQIEMKLVRCKGEPEVAWFDPLSGEWLGGQSSIGGPPVADPRVDKVLKLTPPRALEGKFAAVRVRVD